MSGGVADNKFPVVMTGTCGQFTSFTVPNQRTLSTLIALKKKSSRQEAETYVGLNTAVNPSL